MTKRANSSLDLFPEFGSAPVSTPVSTPAETPSSAPSEPFYGKTATLVFEEVELALGAASAPARQRPAAAGPRLLAALGDLVILALFVAGIALALEIFWDFSQPPATDPFLYAFALVFAFSYSLFAMGFWGRTLGLALFGLRAHNADGSPITVVQAALRFAGVLCCVATLGIAWLVLALKEGGSPADRLSKSSVYRSI